MDVLFTSPKTKNDQEEALKERSKTSVPTQRRVETVSSPETALEALHLEPDIETLEVCLRVLTSPRYPAKFDISKASPLSAQIINSLVSEIAPHYWPILSKAISRSDTDIVEQAAVRRLYITCLQSLAGIGAIHARLKALIQQSKEPSSEGNGKTYEAINLYLDLLAAIIQGKKFLLQIWTRNISDSTSMQRLVWKEIIAYVSGSKLVNTATEAASIASEASPKIEDRAWFTDGMRYSEWIGQNVRYWLQQDPSDSKGGWKDLSMLTSRAFSLGHADVLLKQVLAWLLEDAEGQGVVVAFMKRLPLREQGIVLENVLRMLSTHFPARIPDANPDWMTIDATLVAGAARYIEIIIDGHESRKQHLIAWLTNVSGAGTGDSVGIRRAAVAALSKDKWIMETVLEECFRQFGDQLYIRHTPIIQQEVYTQVLLLTAGCIHRLYPVKLSIMMRTAPYLSAVSNRLASSSQQARFLGMIVGETISSLVDAPDKQMNFKQEELASPEAKWYKSLVHVNDSIGTLEMLKNAITLSSHQLSGVQVKGEGRRLVKAGRSHQETSTKIMSIEEVQDSDESQIDELLPYDKPDSDPEDSDEDATLVQRNKMRAPVYIRDLITYFRDTDNYDRQKLALTSAPDLIRRKIGFGKEVSEHSEELASLLVGLQDKYNIEDFQDFRLQGLIAVILSQPDKMAAWFAKTFFNGDYSQAQRASILTALSVSARELAGYKEEDKHITGVTTPSEQSFPSKTLPPALHAIWMSVQTPTPSSKLVAHASINTLTTSLTRSMIQPLAAKAADLATGPDVLKVRTFSSRLAVEAKRKPPSVNQLSIIVASSYFLPLTSYFNMHLRTYGQGNVVFQPFLLSSFLKALALILHAAGTSCLQLATMTREFWDLLLGVRGQALGEKGEKAVGEAILFGFLTIIEVWTKGAGVDRERRLVEEQGRELVETQKWVEVYFERLCGGSTEDDRIKSLAAAVLLRITDVVGKYQALLIGNMGDL